MYFLSFDTTIRMSRSNVSLKETAAAGAVAAAAGSLARRRVGAPAVGGPPEVAGFAGGGRVIEGADTGPVGAERAPAGDGLAIEDTATGPVGDDLANAGTPVEDPCAGGRVMEAVAGPGRGAAAGVGRAGSEGWLLSSRSHAARLGAIRSSAHASRWRAVAMWLSQHATEQNTRRIRARLHVETLH